MKNLKIGLWCFVIVLAILPAAVYAQVSPPAGWGDFQMGLVNDNSNIINVRMKKALAETVKLHYRYAYVNNGVDPNTNALSWLFNQWGTDYSKNSAEMGLRPGYVIYMLQEEGGATALKNNILNATFMRNYFTSIRIVAEKSNGYKSIFVIEPDTWGYFLQDALQQGTQSDPRLISANVNNLGAGYEYLSDLPNTLSGVALATIRTIRRYAPDAYCGLLMSFWSVNANGATGPPVADGAKGMVYWNQSDVDYSAKRNADFAIQLLGSSGDRGDFIGVEKNGWSAGNWLVKQNRNDYYWNDTQNGKWISWSKTLRQNINLPLLGWQISIGHMGLPNTVNRYEDTFMPYFFTHVQDFINAGFIGFLAGKGLADCTDFTNLSGNELESNGSAGDDGWFFEKLKSFDAGRPYLGVSVGPTVSIASPVSNATFSSGSTITIAANATGGTGCSASKVEFFRGTTKLGEDITSPFSFAWTGVPSGTYALTARVTNSCGATVTSSAVNITVGSNANPTTSITSPSNNATFTAPASVTINANASDTDGTIAKVEFFQGTTSLGVDTSSPYSAVWSSVGAGSYALTAKATDNGGAITTSSTVNITVSGTPVLPSPWQSSDIGSVTPAGSATYSSGTFTVKGAGADIWDVADAFQYVYQPVNGNVEIIARVASLTNTNAWAKAGVMVRETLAANSKHAFAAATPSNGVALQSRSTTGGTSANVGAASTIPVWLKLNRSGNVFTASRSADGVTWTTTGSVTISMTTSVYVGLAVTSHANGTLTTAAFSNVTVTGANALPVASITSPANNATFTAPASVTINATASDSDGTVSKVDFYNGSTLLGSDASSPYSFTWSNVGAGSYALTVKATDNTNATGASSAVVNITVSGTPNVNPTASITSPANNATFTAPASITINANASDSDGTINRVEFYNGATLLGTDTSSPYSFSWTNVAAGSYGLIAKAIDNAGGIGNSSTVNITVSGGGGCTDPQYVENGGYVAGSKVKNVGNSYECRPYPNSGWCNGAAWAYAPGTGTYWADAWVLKGTCTSGRSRTEDYNESPSENKVFTDADGLAMYPNPGKPNTNNFITLNFEKTPAHVKIKLQNVNGVEALDNQYSSIRNNTLTIKLPLLSQGLYIVLIQTENKRWTRKYQVKE
jgi:regulation of enolase protein 1 (concanavalin A-like superfamily)